MANPLKVWDLHSHTSASDGELSPEALWQRAIDNKIDYLAITDHDTTDGASSLARRLSQTAQNGVVGPQVVGPQLVAGVEITAVSERVVIHIVGLWIDFEHPTLSELLAKQRDAREQRGREISVRLERAGLPSTFEGATDQAQGSTLGRPHFAKHMVKAGLVKSEAEAFKRWLGKGKPGDVSIAWPTQTEVIDTIHTAGGVAVLAHPAKYVDGYGKCLDLCRHFKEADGDAMEVVSGAQQDKISRDLARMARHLDLAASTGSDFHSPAQTWCDLGSQPHLPADVKPVWALRS